MSLVIDVHALQSLPPSLINRDDTGAPKIGIFGGVPRQRVSSQSWKRAIRDHFGDHFDKSSVGYRTRMVAELIVRKIQELSDAETWPDDRAAKEVEAVFKTLKISLKEPKAPKGSEDSNEKQRRVLAESGYLLFLSPRQVEKLARAIINADGENITKKVAAELVNTDHSVDMAFFGRMVADDANYNVDAAVQVAHALGIHESEPEFDYFTAVDDLKTGAEDAGAGMIGTTQMMSSTLYRFATVDMTSLAENLGDGERAATSAVQFVSSFIESMPTGKQNSFANNTLPELVYVTVRDTRSISLVNAFEEPVATDSDTGRRLAGALRLANEAREIQEQYGFIPKGAFVVGLGELREPFVDLATQTTLPELGSLLRDSLSSEVR